MIDLKNHSKNVLVIVRYPVEDSEASRFPRKPQCACPKLINNCHVGDKLTPLVDISAFVLVYSLIILCENAMKASGDFFWSSVYNISEIGNPLSKFLDLPLDTPWYVLSV